MTKVYVLRDVSSVEVDFFEVWSSLEGAVNRRQEICESQTDDPNELHEMIKFDYTIEQVEVQS